MHFANAVPLDKTHPEQFGGGQQFGSLFQLEADIWPAMFAMLHQGLINITSQSNPIQTSEPTNLDIFSQVLHGYRRLRGNVAKRWGGLVGRWLEDVGNWREGPIYIDVYWVSSLLGIRFVSLRTLKQESTLTKPTVWIPKTNWWIRAGVFLVVDLSLRVCRPCWGRGFE